ncbi:transposase [Thiomonas sp. X19]|nr:transposase [Thiomonas sp. X19]
MPTRSTQHGPHTSSVVQMPTDSVVTNPVRSRAAGRLEPCAGKLACTVLRGEHAGNGVFLPDGKARKPYEFGVKTAVVVSHQQGLMLGARTFPGNPYDGHILRATLEQATILMQDWKVAIQHVVVDLGFRGVDADNPGQHILHRGKFKRMSLQHRGWLRRRSAVEPAIGHLKADHRLDRCWLQGALGDALHALSCAAGYNLRWLLRAIARLGLGPVFLRRLRQALRAARAVDASRSAHSRAQALA